MMNASLLPKNVFSGYFKGGHCQGIAVDTKREYIYYSFTTELVKTDLQGNLIGSVTGLLGHLGCIDFNDADGRVYGSLEYKNDAIGKGILKNLGSSAEIENAFYIAVFDVEKIDRVGMDACESGVMKAVWLKEVVDDYLDSVTCGGKELPHRLGCSGIDGTSFGPMPGSDDKKQYLFVTYGVYGDVKRADNDYQVVLCYDTENWAQYEMSLSQAAMHKNGPAAPEKKFFVYTGNTEWGVQNLEYDPHTNAFLMAVYRGRKESFPNYGLFAVDAAKAPVKGVLRGVEYLEEGDVLSLAEMGEQDEKTGVRGWYFKYGTTGLHSFGDGYFYISHDGRDENGWFTNVKLYKWDGVNPMALVEE